MLMKIRRELAVGGAVVMLSVAILTTGTMFAQSATPTPMDGMMDMASPTVDATPMAMTMEECMAMMRDMMMATPGAGMHGMDTPVSGT